MFKRPTTEEVRNVLFRTREVRPIDLRCYFLSLRNDESSPSQIRASNATIANEVAETFDSRDRRRTFRKIVTYVESMIDVQFPRDEELLIAGLGSVLYEAALAKPSRTILDERLDELARAHVRHVETVTGEYSFDRAFDAS